MNKQFSNLNINKLFDINSKDTKKLTKELRYQESIINNNIELQKQLEEEKEEENVNRK